ncbi:MAG: tetratricopeptide repeat protein [Planctomycetota bacterium]|jgi:TPR repeat protein
MKCCKCKAEIADGVRFCPECGASLADVEAMRVRCLKDVRECERAVSVGEGSRPYIRRNFDERLPEWKQAADLGIPEAQWLLARCYDEGFGVERNEIHAISWHLKAAEQGYAAAQNHLGSCYQNGSGVPQDEAEAVEWYRKAAEQGYAIAQSNLGWCYDTGTGVAQDEAEAAKCYRKAAEQGDYTSQYNLGVHCEWGSGIDQDKAEALKWYRKAADQGYEQAEEAFKRLTDEVATEEKERQAKAEDAEQRFRRACKEALADGKLSLDEKAELKSGSESLGVSKEVRKQVFEQEKEIFLRDRKAQRAKDAEFKFRIACKNVITDGKVTLDEKDELRDLGKSLNIPREVMKRLFEDEKRNFLVSHKVQPTKSVELQFRKACKRVLADGKVTPDEESELKGLAKLLRISNEVMKRILADEVEIFRQSQKNAPNKNVELQFRKACKEALADGKVTPEEEKQLKDLAEFLRVPKEAVKQIFADEARIYRQAHSATSAT